MSNEEFLRRLEALLEGKMPPQEIQSVMEYHREYFAEAGENAAAELDPPEVIAQRVLDEYFTPPAKRGHRWIKGVAIAVLCTVLVAVFAGGAVYSGLVRRLLPSSLYEAVTVVEDAVMPQRHSDEEHGHQQIAQVEQYAYAQTDLVTTTEGDRICTTGTLEPFESIFVEGVSDDVTVVYGDAFFLDIWHDDRETVDCNVRNSSLHITGETKGIFSAGFQSGAITIIVPQGTSLSVIQIETDMGDICLEDLQAGEVELTAELGDVMVSGGSYVTLDCDSDMGDVVVQSVQANGLSCACDTGNIEAVSFDARTTELEADLGSITAVAVGSQRDYTLELEVDLGELKISGEKVSSSYVQSGKDRSIHAEADVGSITLDFV